MSDPKPRPPITPNPDFTLERGKAIDHIALCRRCGKERENQQDEYPLCIECEINARKREWPSNN